MRKLPALRKQDYAEIVAALVGVAITAGLVDTLVVYQWRKPVSLGVIITLGFSGFITTTVARRVTDRRRTYRD